MSFRRMGILRMPGADKAFPKALSKRLQRRLDPRSSRCVNSPAHRPFQA